MIGRWVLWMNFFVPWVLIYLQLKIETLWDGSWRRIGILISAHFIISYEVPCPLSFLGKVFGRLRLLGVFLSLFGLLFGIRFLQLTICGVEGFILLTSALCVVVMGRQWIICYFIVETGKAYWLWSLVFRSFGISWVLPRTVADTLFGWWNWFGKHSSSIWNLVPLWLMWCIWRERNWRTFEGMKSSDDQLLAYFSGSLFDWFRAWGLTSGDSLPMFLSSLFCN